VYVLRKPQPSGEDQVSPMNLIPMVTFPCLSCHWTVSGGGHEFILDAITTLRE
jgi:hypothetical protein